MSPTASHPSTPSAESGAAAWGPHPTSATGIGRPQIGSNTFTWGTGIWNSDRKEPPARLAEVLPSPNSSLPTSTSLLGPDGGPHQTSPAPRESGPNSQIPFAIPIHPTPKNYRSQSYSVGQLDPETPNAMMGSSAILGSRNRGIPHSGLQHRPSRPSMLSEMSNEGGMLGKVKEVEDDETGSVEAAQGQAQSAEAKTIEMLTRENAMLRQQQYHAAANRMRPRASTGFGGIGNGYGLHDPVPEENSDYAVDLDESGELSDLAGKRAFGRRMSEFGSGPFRSSFSLENRPLENVKKALWSSSLGFGGLADIPQSRRHSFAEIPTRQPSIGSIGDHVHAQDPGSQEGQDFAVGQYENSLLNAGNAGKLQRTCQDQARYANTLYQVLTLLVHPESTVASRRLCSRPIQTCTRRLMDYRLRFRIGPLLHTERYTACLSHDTLKSSTLFSSNVIERMSSTYRRALVSQ